MNASNKYVCIHGHFYQPPRENAWLEVIERQDSAAPFHNWNARINFECYAPNTAARILDESQYIRNILNNYSYLSFNLGATLLSWMEAHDPDAYQGVLDADKISQARFGGHGSAIAQVHSHLILPLCNRRDKETQVVWGIQDFEHRFNRKPEGMWLAETAVDTESLEVLAENGILYTILAPRQAKAIRTLDGAGEWTSVNTDTLDTRRPYRCLLPSGKHIDLFFYHGAIAQGVAFDGLLNSGKTFSDRLLSDFTDDETPELLHIATDGESYGHHHRYGEMALADAIAHILAGRLAKMTNYGQYLELFPPKYEAQIHENSSWSCAHGVERWRSNCGCNTGGNAGWNQSWRGPLRDALNWLRDELIPVYEREGSKLLKDVWEARNAYYKVLLHSNPRQIDRFLEQHARRELTSAEQSQVLRMLEMQRHSLLMFTSCGWFFDEVSGIETLQILQYANRATYYAQQVSGKDYHKGLLDRLEKTPSNTYANAAEAYREFVLPARVDLDRVGMHYAASSLFEEYPERLELFNYVAESEVYDRERAGSLRLAVGRTVVTSRRTHSRKHFSFAVLYLGQQNMIGNISIDMQRSAFDEMRASIIDAFRHPDLGHVIGIMQDYFGPEKFSFGHLFRDERLKILDQITARKLKRAEAAFREVVNDNYQLMTGMLQAKLPIPPVFLHATQFVLNKDLEAFFENGSLHVRELTRLAREIKKWKIPISDLQTVKLKASERIYHELQGIDQTASSAEPLNNLATVLETVYSMGIQPDIWKTQNLYFSMIKGYKSGDWVFASEEWKEAFLRLGALLRVQTS